MMHAFRTMASLACLALVAACNTADGVKKDADIAAEKTAEAASATGSAVEGAARFPRVKNERYELANLFDLPAEFRGAFDWVWEHTCFCAIDPSMRAAYVEAVAGALKPGGKLLAIFYLDPGNDHPDEGPPFEVSVAELDALFLPRFELKREWLPAGAYPGREGREWMRILRKSE